MDYKVKVEGDIIVSDEKLPEFLALVGTKLVIEPVMAADAVSEAAPAKPKATRKSSGRKSKPDPAPMQAAETQANVEPEAKAADEDEEIDREKLLEKFTRKVDEDYDGALDLLESFGVSRFSELEDNQLADFAGRL